jgi:alpha-L-fucosidase 2
MISSKLFPMRLTQMTFMVFLVVSVATPVLSQSKPSQLKLWFNKPASDWNEALPVGNGRLGAMIFGNVNHERLQLNESSVWSGAPVDFVNPKAKTSLPKIRKLLFEGHYAEAQDLAQRDMMGDKKVESSYQTLGDLWLDLNHGNHSINNYKRELDLEIAIAKVSYEMQGIQFIREIFSSAPDQVIVVRLTADKTKSISLNLHVSRPGNKASIKNDNETLWMREHVNNGVGVKLTSAFKVLTDGIVNASDTSIDVKNADAVTIFISAATDYEKKDFETICKNHLQNAASQSYEELRKKHIADYQQYFKRVSFDLGVTDAIYFPTDARVAATQQGNIDPQLITLYYQFGRYLLISSSRPGGLPANLQGIWADGLTPPWSADYHININIQMNYWLSELTNLSELHEPFLRFINALREDGKKTARDMYGVNGAVAHFTTDAWHFTETYGQPRWAMWPMGMAWSVEHLWEHYLFTKDEKYLREFAYPAMKDAAIFCKEWLVKDPATGNFVSGPSISPENGFKADEGKIATMVMGPTMDHMIIRELFINTIAASKILKTDAPFASSLDRMLKKLAPTKLGSDGRILEWTKTFEEPEPGHRHISHLYGLHPGKELTKDSLLMKAARKTIDYRLSHGGGHTGWSRAWIINFFARLHDGDAANENLQALLRKSTLPNLFDNHPPFQIDGNFGATAGITEMLLQSHTDEIQILPALPKAWRKGSIHGICARGGVVVNIDWENGVASRISILSKVGGLIKLRNGAKVIALTTEEGKNYTFNGKLELQQ